MNERMLEIAKQAGLKKDHASDREYIGDFDWRLFGELIVGECIKQLGKIQLVEGDQWMKDKEETYLAHTETICIAQNWIKESFGVE